MKEFSKSENGFLASILSLLSVSIRFDPIVMRICFLTMPSPVANRFRAVLANSNVSSARVNHFSRRPPVF